MSEPRGVESRIKYMLDHPPGDPGWCARETWEASGGNQNPPSPPAWSCENASEVVAKARKAGVLYTGRDVPRGAIVLWEDRAGHMCFSNGDGSITSTDPNSKWGQTGVMDFDYPEDSWDLTYAGWLIRYAGTLLPMSEPGPVYVDRLVQGQADSASVVRLQDVLNHTSLPAPGNIDLPPTGFYGEETQTVVQVWQEENGYPKGPLTNAQCDALFAGTGHSVIHATEPQPPDPPDPPEPPDDPDTITLPLGIEYHYSGKPAGSLSFGGDYKRLDVASFAPKKDGLTLGMIYANVDGSGEFRSRLIRENPSDETAYQTHYPKSGDNYLLTHVWFESGEGGRPLHYELKTMDGETMTVSTRYAKFVTIPWDVTATIDTAARAYETARRYAPAAGALLILLAFLGIYSVAT